MLPVLSGLVLERPGGGEKRHELSAHSIASMSKATPGSGRLASVFLPVEACKASTVCGHIVMPQVISHAHKSSWSRRSQTTRDVVVLQAWASFTADLGKRELKNPLAAYHKRLTSPKDAQQRDAAVSPHR